MANKKEIYYCTECGYESSKWLGKCPSCNSWGSIKEVPKSFLKKDNSINNLAIDPKTINSIDVKTEDRISVGINEFDRVLGGGLVKGSLILLGGDPGIGKSTIILQICKNISDNGYKVLYISGEESESQIKLRSERIGSFNDNFLLLNETNLDTIVELAKKINPNLLIIDSIQTMSNPDISSIAGSVSQVKESTSILMKLAKNNNINTIIIGHVTKDGTVAGPKLLEHMVDTVLYFEGEKYDTYRMLRGIKNRFGATNEVGIFDMTDKGLKEVKNPSELMLQGRPVGAAGSIITSVQEGTRAILVEIQALVTKTSFGIPRRTAVGIDYNRVNLLIAVIEKRLKINLSEYDVYINVVGGIKIQDTSVDLPIVLAILSSYYNKPFGNEVMAIGEVGLVGEVRTVSNVITRINEAKKLGYKYIYLPEANLNSTKNIEGVKLRGIKEIHELINK